MEAWEGPILEMFSGSVFQNGFWLLNNFFSVSSVIIDFVAAFFHCVILDYYTLLFLMLFEKKNRYT